MGGERSCKQSLKEDGSQIDDRQEFPALDQEAYQHSEPNAGSTIETLGEETIGNEIADGISAFPDAAVPTQNAAIVEEIASPRQPITTEDSPDQSRLKAKWRSAAAFAEHLSKQLSFW